MKILAFSLLFLPLIAGAQILPPNTETTTYRAVTIATADGLSLSGQLALPADKSGPFPAVLLLAGSGRINRYENIPGGGTADGKPALLYKGIEDALIAKGVAVFSYDKRGIIPKDGSFFENDVSDVYARTAGGENLSSDALRAYDLLKSLPDVDASRIGILGHSEGTVLALRIAEARPEVRTLLLLGFFTRSFRDILNYQDVQNQLRAFDLIDGNGDGLLTAEEYAPFQAQGLSLGKNWAQVLALFDQTVDSKISRQEFQFFFEQQDVDTIEAVMSDTIPWRGATPRIWLREYLQMGPFLERHSRLCAKEHVFQGEVDVETPFEDALGLRAACAAKKTPLASFRSYPGVGHAFSPRVGLKSWKDTVGPMSPEVQKDVADVAAAELRL